MDGKSEGRGVQSIEIGARLIAALANAQGPMMLKDLARLADFAPAQAHAYLVSYRKIGLVDQDPDTGRYMLGPFALDLGLTRMRAMDVMQLASETVIDLSERTALNVALVVWGTFGPTVVQLRESGGQLNMSTRPGSVYSMSGTATGRTFSAFMPEKMVKEAVRKEKRESASTGRVGFHCFLPKKELETIRKQGYATVKDPPIPGINAFSAPVFDHFGQMVLAITMIGQAQYLNENTQDHYVGLLLDATRTLSMNLGHNPEADALPDDGG